MGGAVLASIAVHAGLLMLVLWVQTRDVGQGVGGPGRAGGGGGGAPEVSFVDITAYVPSSAPAPARRATENLEYVTVRPQLKTIARSTPKVKVWEPTRPDLSLLSTSPGTSGGPGSGRGTGGGRGAGVGTGVGDNVGPGTGGERAPAYAPEPRSVVYPISEPPDSVRGRLLIIHFWVDVRGRVSKVEVEPPLLGGSYLEDFLKNMRQWTFYPARTADGRPVDGELVVTHRP